MSMGEMTTAFAAMVQRTPWLSAVLVLVAGWLIALVLRLGLAKLLELVRFNKLFDRLGVSEFLRKGQVRNTPSKLVGILGFWLVLILTFFQIARILDIKILGSVSDRIAESAPSVVAALFIGIIGLVSVSFLANFVATLARTAGLPHARLLSRGTRAVGALIIVVLALEQLHLSGTLLSSLVLIIVGAAASGTALAFGLGCKDMAREALQKILAGLRERDRASRGPDLEG